MQTFGQRQLHPLSLAGSVPAPARCKPQRPAIPCSWDTRRFLRVRLPASAQTRGAAGHPPSRRYAPAVSAVCSRRAVIDGACASRPPPRPPERPVARIALDAAILHDFPTRRIARHHRHLLARGWSCAALKTRSLGGRDFNQQLERGCGRTARECLEVNSQHSRKRLRAPQVLLCRLSDARPVQHPKSQGNWLLRARWTRSSRTWRGQKPLGA